jgi:8-oxo-dGTP pyrophosphatase MutT (NUDIX family)
MDDMIFVLIFAFDPQGRVLLRMKGQESHQGEWQAGRWNGLGGKKNDLDEAARQAILEKHGQQEYFESDIVRLCARRKLREEASLEVSHHRFKGGIYVPYPQANLYVYWILLLNDEAEKVHYLKGPGGSVPAGEYNQWFTADNLNDLVNQDRVAMEEAHIDVAPGGDWMVDSTVEFVDLIKSLGHWFGN